MRLKRKQWPIFHKCAPGPTASPSREALLLLNATRRLGQPLALADIYELVYETLQAFIADAALFIALFNPEEQELEYVYGRSPHGPIPLAQRQTPSELLIHDILGGLPRLVTPAQTSLFDSPFAALPSAAGPFRAALLLPYPMDAQNHAILQIYHTLPDALPMRHRGYLEHLARHATVAMGNAHLFARLQQELHERRGAETAAQKREAEAETLRQAAAILNSSLSLDVVLTRILEQLRQAIPYDSATVQQKEEDHLVIRAAHGFPDNEGLINLGFQIQANLPNAHALRNLQPLALTNVRQAFPCFCELAEQYQAERIVSWLGVPLTLDDQVLGMITIDRNSVWPFTEREIALAVTFADHASIALQNARLYQELASYNERLEEAVARRTLELQHAITQVEAILNHSPEAMLLLDANLCVERANPAFTALFGYENDEVLNAAPFFLVTEADYEDVVAVCQTAVTHGSPQRTIFTARHKDGNLLEVNAALAPIHKNKHVVALVCVIHDITAFKEVERLKDDFVSNVSHELRTPITNLKLHYDLILLNPARQEVYMERLGREINRLNIIVESLLRLSRLDQRRVEVNPTILDLAALANQYVLDRTSQAESNGLTLCLATDSPAPPVKADAKLLEQVIGILLTNAINYTPTGGHIHLKVVTRQTNEGAWAGISIADSGPGILPGEESQVFNRFYRGQVGRSSGVPGTGLGLSIAQEIMSLHQGHVELVGSGASQGATFIMWLPALRSHTV